MAFSGKNESLIYHLCMIIRRIHVNHVQGAGIMEILNLLSQPYSKRFHDKAQHWVFFGHESNYFGL